MAIGFQIWLALAGLVGLVWLGRLCVIGTFLRRRMILGSHSYPDPPEQLPRISVIVAAKDEEENIEACISGLLLQEYPAFEVVAIDDRSRDRTPQILTNLMNRADGRLRVVTVKALRDGWFGKNNAMREGVETATGDWLCFTDADCRDFSPRTLVVAMGEALKQNIDFLSITPVLETETLWERITQPVCALILMIWFLPWRVNDPSKKTAYANGAFMLIRRSCYEAVGGHERVRTELNEDIRLADLAKRHGFHLRVVENGDLYRTRMYRTPAEAWRGWSRIFFGSLGSLRRLATAALMVMLFSILPWASFAAALIGCQGATTANPSPWIAAGWAWLAVVTLQQAVLWRAYSVLRVASPWSFTYVLGAVIALGMLVSAMFKVVGASATTWRGTTYRGDRLEAGRAVPLAPAPTAANPIEESVSDA